MSPAPWHWPSGRLNWPGLVRSVWTRTAWRYWRRAGRTRPWPNCGGWSATILPVCGCTISRACHAAGDEESALEAWDEARHERELSLQQIPFYEQAQYRAFAELLGKEP